MEPFVGLDVSKGTSVAQAFTSRNGTAGKPKCISDTEKGFEEFGEWLGELRQKTGKEPVVVNIEKRDSSGLNMNCPVICCEDFREKGERMVEK